ncbi:MAG: MFS transporter [Deltaproteobacteria bacterium]|nr:MFS transporter [Deltaproteobacteria bacterium]
MSGAKGPLSYPIFRALWLSGVVSFIGSFVQNVGEAWLMLDLTKSPLAVSLLATTVVGTSVVWMLPAGLLADRYDKRKVLIASQLLQALAALTMAALSYTHHITPSALLFGVALLGTGMALGVPAWGALNPELLPRELVAEGVALNAVAFNLARAVGPAIGGVVLDTVGATGSFLLNAASFGIVLIPLFAFLHVKLEGADASAPAPLAPGRNAFRAPLAAIRGDEGLRSIFLAMFLFSLGAGMFYALTPAFGKETLRETARQYGIMIGMMGGGALLGATVLKRLRPRVAPRVLIGSAMALFATFGFAVANAPTIPIAMALFVPAGAGWIGSFSSIAALNQVWAPSGLRARIIALYQLVHLATWTITSALGGVIAERFGVRVAMSIGTAVCAMAAIATFRVGLPTSFTPSLRPQELRQPEA